MNHEEHFDDHFRKALNAADPGAAPEMDFGAMARMAKQGAGDRAAGTRVRGNRWSGVAGVAVGAVVCASLLALALVGDDDVLFVATPQAASTHKQVLLPSGMVPDADDVRDTNAGAGVVNEKVPTPVGVSAEDGGIRPMAATRLPQPSGKSYADRKETVALPDLSATGHEAAIPVQGLERTGYIGSPGTVTDDLSVAQRMELMHPQASLTTQGLMHAHLPQQPPLRTWSRFALSPWAGLGHAVHADVAGPVGGSITGDRGYVGAFGLRVHVAITPRVEVITGVQYARKGRMEGAVSGTSVHTTHYSLGGAYWEVPVGMALTLPLENKELYVRAGGLLQWNAGRGKDHVVMEDVGLKERSTLTLATASTGAALDLGIGARFRLGRNVSLFVEPSYQLALTTVVQHSSADQLPFNPRINTFSLSTGLLLRTSPR